MVIMTDVQIDDIIMNTFCEIDLTPRGSYLSIDISDRSVIVMTRFVFSGVSPLRVAAHATQWVI